MDALFVFARAPVPGAVKTRLARTVGDDAAAALHAAFVDDVCRLTRGLADRRVLAVAGDVGHPELARIAAREGMEIAPQAMGDLGTRMGAAIDDGLGAGAARVAIVGSDSPTLAPAMVRGAFECLGSAEVVLGPAQDGGYWIVGATGSVPWLFAGIPWGTGTVFAETMERVARRGGRCAVVARFWDVDDALDLARLEATLAADPAPDLAPATRDVMARLRVAARG